MVYTLPLLSYSYDALEPYIDALTMEIHYTKHHQAYIDNLNKALEAYPDLQKKPLITLLQDLSAVPESIRAAVRNNGGGHFNHSLFWPLMKKNGGGQPKDKVLAAITKKFGNFSTFQDQFNAAAKSRFGSGWAWLSVDKNGEIVLGSTANQDTPYEQGTIPFFGLDVWEHAYYLKYQNRRPDYINAWWHVIAWDQVEDNYNAILAKL